MNRLLSPLLALLLALCPSAPKRAAVQAGSQSPQISSPQEQDLVRSFEAQGVRFDPARGLAGISAAVEVRDDLIEYLLAGPAGAVHETAFTTDVLPSVLGTALRALGTEPGTNARWKPKEPQPTEEELREGASPYDVEVPRGGGLYLYGAWRRGEEVYFFRAEDLVRNLATGQTMQRHAWVFLGSRFLPRKEGPEVLAADLYQNLINVSFFSEGFTLLTCALPECVHQTIWLANAWLLPERGERVALIFARSRLDALPADWAAGLPEVAGAGGR